MLGIQTLSKLKKQHKYIFHTTIGDIGVTFRLLTWDEWNFYTKAGHYNLDDPLAIEDHIFQEIVLDPLLVDQINLLPPGVITTVVSLVMALSGNSLSSEDELSALNGDLAMTRGAHESVIYEQLIRIICSAFPAYTLQEIESLPFPEILRLVVMAEKILNLGPIDLSKAKKVKKSVATQFVEDAKEAEKADRARPPGRDVRDVIQDRMANDPNAKQNRQQQMIELIRRRNAMKVG